MQIERNDKPDITLDHLRSVVQEVSAADDLSTALSIIVNRTNKIMETQVCSVYLKEASTGRLVFMATNGLNKSLEGKFSLEPDQGLVGLVAHREEPLNLENAKAHENYYYIPNVGEDNIVSFLGVPIIHQKNVLGVLVVQQNSIRLFLDREEAFLVTLSAQLAGVIAHARVLAETHKKNAVTQSDEPIQIKQDADFCGMSNSQGVAIGTLVLRLVSTDLKSVSMRKTDTVDAELALFSESLERVKQDVSRLITTLNQHLPKEEVSLFDVYLSMIDDEVLIGKVTALIKEGYWAQGAWAQEILGYIHRFEKMEDKYFKERASDVKDFGLRVLKYLRDVNDKKFEYPKDTILVSDELTPSMLVEVPADQLKGLVSCKGSCNSHVSILAQSLGLPIVMGVSHLPINLLDEQRVIVDGYRAKVFLNVSNALCRRYQALVDEEKIIEQDLQNLQYEKCITKDDYSLSLFVNIGLYHDICKSLDLGAQGVGLYRTETPFLLGNAFPTEKQQQAIYRRQLELFSPLPVTMRTLDIGGDKNLEYFPISEENPFLGWRGIRVTLDHPEIFLVQIRAMLKASHELNNLQIMLPMISHFSELEGALGLISRAFDEVVSEGYRIEYPKVGVMIEVPASVFQAQEYAKRVDFLSVGSNDLTQYLLAVDRNNPNVSSLYDSFHPSVLRACYEIVKAAHAEGKPVSICGEMAGNPLSAVLLMAMGFDMLSMNSIRLLRVKSLIRAVTITQARAILSDVLTLRSAELVKARLYEFLDGLGVLTNLHIDKEFLRGD
jgi:phosphotransferase system, enzyme I, PtsP